MRSFQYLDALEIGRVEVGNQDIAPRRRGGGSNRSVVYVDANGRRIFRAGGDTADDELFKPFAIVVEGQSRDAAEIVTQADLVRGQQRLRVNGSDGKGNVLQQLFTALRADHDFL